MKTFRFIVDIREEDIDGNNIDVKQVVRSIRSALEEEWNVEAYTWGKHQWTKEMIKEVLEANDILGANLYRNGMCPSDLSDEDYMSDLVDVLNNPKYKQELIEENELG